MPVTIRGRIYSGGDPWEDGMLFEEDEYVWTEVTLGLDLLLPEQEPPRNRLEGTLTAAFLGLTVSWQLSTAGGLLQRFANELERLRTRGAGRALFQDYWALPLLHVTTSRRRQPYYLVGLCLFTLAIGAMPLTAAEFARREIDLGLGRRPPRRQADVIFYLEGMVIDQQQLRELIDYLTSVLRSTGVDLELLW